MSDLSIECPSCGAHFALNDVLSGQMREHMKKELAAGLKQQEKALMEKVRQDAQAQFEVEKTALQDDLASKDQKIKIFQEQELALRKKQREVEESKAALELELNRKLDAEREQIKKQVLEQAGEAHKLKDLEKDRKIKELSEALESANRKAQQGSMESQGEVLEDLLESRLPRLFPHDAFQPVPKGVKGADLIQLVRTSMGEECGVLLWEAKNTKAWSKDWIPKLKEDLIQVRGHLAILVSSKLPDGLERFGVVDGVWVADEASAGGLAVALREQLLAVAREKTVLEGQQDKMSVLYHYLMGNEFKQKIEGIVDAFSSMQAQIAQERRAMEKQWKAREKMVERVMKNTVGLHGDIQGIAGGQLPSIPALELSDDQGPLELEEGD